MGVFVYEKGLTVQLFQFFGDCHDYQPIDHWVRVEQPNPILI
jgi:hypothetical protein